MYTVQVYFRKVLIDEIKILTKYLEIPQWGYFT